jgi:hypothetical protein
MNIIHTSFFRELDILDKIGELSIETISDIFNKNIWRFPIKNVFFKNTKYEIVLAFIYDIVIYKF